jgi:hypothetical protein
MSHFPLTCLAGVKGVPVRAQIAYQINIPEQRAQAQCRRGGRRADAGGREGKRSRQGGGIRQKAEPGAPEDNQQVVSLIETTAPELTEQMGWL